jgi:hypothetical protein
MNTVQTHRPRCRLRSGVCQPQNGTINVYSGELFYGDIPEPRPRSWLTTRLTLGCEGQQTAYPAGHRT